jgi:phage I-like protein
MTTLTEDQSAELARMVGVRADSDGATVVAAVREALDEQARAGAITPAEAMDALREAPGPEAVLVDASMFGLMKADLEELAALRAERDDQAISAAVRKGFVLPAARASWKAQMRQDPEATKKALAELKTPLVPLAATGYDSGDGDWGDPQNQPGWSDVYFNDGKTR